MKSERPTKNKLPAPYGFDPNAQIRIPKQGNFSTADSTLRENRQIAHKEALRSEQKHYADVHSTHPRTISSKPEPKPSNYQEPHGI